VEGPLSLPKDLCRAAINRGEQKLLQLARTSAPLPVRKDYLMVTDGVGFGHSTRECEFENCIAALRMSGDSETDRRGVVGSAAKPVKRCSDVRLEDSAREVDLALQYEAMLRPARAKKPSWR